MMLLRGLDLGVAGGVTAFSDARSMGLRGSGVPEVSQTHGTEAPAPHAGGYPARLGENGFLLSCSPLFM